MNSYEMIREIFNSCSNNQMRDVFFSEIESDDLDSVVRPYLTGKDVSCERIDLGDGSVEYNIVTDGLAQRITFTII